MKRFFIDSNIFLRFFDRTSESYKRCKNLFSLVEKGEIRGIVCSVVLLEVYFTLRRYYALSKKDAQQKIMSLLRSRNFSFDDSFNYLAAADLWEVTGVKFPDCLIASTKFLRNGGTIVSFDRDFDKLGVKRVEPGGKMANY